MARRISADRKHKSSHAKGSDGAAARARTKRSRGKRSLLSRLKFW